jgi:hypothetical protein
MICLWYLFCENQKEKLTLPIFILLLFTPVVVVFGSITCPPFRSMFLKEIDEIVEEQKGKVKLVVVYLAEAHPKDGWHLGVNDKKEVSSLLPSL